MEVNFPRKGSITRECRHSSELAVQLVGVSEFNALRSTFTIPDSTMRINTSMMMSELGKLLIKWRGGYRPNASDI